MYSVTIENLRSTSVKEILIWSDNTATDFTKVESVELNLSANSAGSLSITIPYNNIGYSEIEHLTTIFRVYKKDTSGVPVEIWRGRAISEEKNFNNSRVIFVEGELAYLNDTVVSPMQYTNPTISDFLEDILAQHNERAIPAKTFRLGTVTVETGNDSMGYISTVYQTTWECISKNLLEVYGGVLKVRYGSNGIRYLDYLKISPLPSAITQKIVFGSNLIDLTKSWDLSDFATVIVPIGKQLDTPSIENNVVYDPNVDDGSFIYVDPETTTELRNQEMANIFTTNPTLVIGNRNYRKILFYKKENDVHPLATGSVAYVKNKKATSSVDYIKKGVIDDEFPDIDRYVTIADANNGSIYLVNQEAVYSYGRIEKVVEFSEAEDAETLMALANIYLTSLQFDDMNIELEAVDLHYFDINIEDINLFDVVNVRSIPHGLDKNFMVTELRVRLDDPSSSSIKLSGHVEGVRAKVSDIVGYALTGTPLQRNAKTVVDAGAAIRPRN